MTAAELLLTTLHAGDGLVWCARKEILAAKLCLDGSRHLRVAIEGATVLARELFATLEPASTI